MISYSPVCAVIIPLQTRNIIEEGGFIFCDMYDGEYQKLVSGEIQSFLWYSDEL